MSAVCLCWLVFTVLTMGVGWLGFGLCVFLVFLVLLYVVTKDSQGSTAATDRRRHRQLYFEPEVDLPVSHANVRRATA